MTEFETVTLERDIACAPERLFHLMTDRESRQKWSAPDDQTTVIIDYFDCRAGGREETRCGPIEAPEFTTVSQFHVVEPEFLCFTETLVIGGEMMSISLCSHDIAPSDTGSKLRVTLQITSLVGAELFGDYHGGWSAALDALAAMATASGPLQ